MSNELSLLLYTVAGVDLRESATRWLDGLDRPDAPMKGLLEHVREGNVFGAHFMMANIGPRAIEDGASNQEILLYAVLAAYQNDEFPGSDRWTTPQAHLERALLHAKQLGDSGVAKSLLTSVAHRSTREPSKWMQEALSRSMKHDPARMAAHDQDMAGIDARDVRAAALLDPVVTVDGLLMGET